MDIMSTHWPPQDPSLLKRIKDGVKKLLSWLSGKLGKESPVNKQSTVEDIDRLSQIFAEYRKSVEAQAEALERELCDDLTAMAEDLRFAVQGDSALFQKYNVRLQRFDRLLDTLPGRMEHTVVNRVSRVVSMDSPECLRVLRMLPGTQKDEAAAKLFRFAIQQGQQAAVDRAKELADELIEEYEDAVSGVLDRLTLDAETLEKKAAQIIDSGERSASDMQRDQAACETVRQATLLLDAVLTVPDKE